MTIKQLIKEHRDYYLQYYRNTLRKLEDGVPELLIEINNNETESLFKLYRFDYVNKKDDKPNLIDFNNDGFLNHEKIEFTVNDLIVEFNPIIWNGCEISLDGKLSNWNEFYAWIRRWIDINNEKLKDKDGLYGVIHNVTKPVFKNGWLTFSIDFGTSPDDSLIELIEIFLNEESIKTIRLSSDVL